MMKKRVVLILLMLVICSMGLMSYGYAETTAERFEVQVVPGFEGMYRESGNIPAKLIIKNNGSDFKGKVELRYHINSSNDVALEGDLDISSNDSYKQTLLITTSYYDFNVVKVIMYDENNNEVYKRNLSMGRYQRIDDDKTVVGILSDSKDDLKYIYPNQQTIRKFLAYDNFPRSKYEFEIFDYILINNYDVSLLNDKQIDSLKQWVTKGGKLLIGTGPHYSKTVNKLSDFIGIDKVTGTKEVSFDSLRLYATNKDIGPKVDGPLIIADIKGLGNTATTHKEDKDGVIYRIPKVSGSVVIFGFDLESEIFTTYPSNNDVISKYITDAYDRDRYSSRNDYYQIDRFLRGIPELKLPDLAMIIAIICAYILIINPILYLYLKKRKKRHYLWGVIPALAIIFVVFMYFAGLNTRIKEPVTQTINAVYFGEEQSEVSSNMMLLPVSASEVTLSSKDNLDIMPVGYNDYRRYSSGNAYVDFPTRFTSNFNDGSTVKIHELTTFESCNFMIESSDKLMIDNRITLDIQKADGKLKGTISSDYDFTFDEAQLYYKGNVYDLGEISKGDTIDLDKKEKVANRYYEDYYEEKLDNAQSINDKHLFDQKRRIISHLFRRYKIDDMLDSYYNGKAVFVGWTKESFTNGYEINGRDVKNYEKTVICTTVDISYKKGDKIVIGEGEIRPRGQSNISNEGREHIYYGRDSDFTMYYNIREDMDLKSILVNNNHDNVASFFIIAKDGTEVELGPVSYEIGSKFIEDYLIDMRLNIRVQRKPGDNNKDSEIILPSIYVEGVAR